MGLPSGRPKMAGSIIPLVLPSPVIHPYTPNRQCLTEWLENHDRLRLGWRSYVGRVAVAVKEPEDLSGT
jgi:hypothetical protein